MNSAVRSAVGSAVFSAVSSTVDSAVESAVGSSVGSAVSLAVYSAVTSNVSSPVNSTVNSAVNSAVYSAASSDVYSAVSSTVDSSVNSSVNSAVYSAVSSAASLAYVNPLFGNQWAGYAGWAEFFYNECGVQLSADFIRQAEHGHYYWPLKTVCICSDRPTEIHTDNADRSHNDTGPAVVYESGWGPYCWHGVTVPAQWIVGTKPTASEAIRWDNMEQRRAACEIVGWHNILRELNASVIDDNPNPFVGQLLSVDIPDIGQEKFLRVRCGTAREFALPVPPEIERASQAQAWLNFTTEDMYLPQVRT